MAQKVECCHPDDPLIAAQQKMRSRQVRRLPVTDAEGELLGMLSLNDLARAAADHSATGGHIAPEQVAATLAAVCATRSHAGHERAQAAE
jgi:CBS domain-containing protein